MTTSDSIPAVSAGQIRVRGAATHNLKHIDVDIPRNQLVVITGVSGSGKSSLAFDTIFVEGQRRFLETLGGGQRQLLENFPRPKLQSLTGLPPTLSLEQRQTAPSARSTVGTLSEIADLLRLVYARAGTAHCPTCGIPIGSQSRKQIVERILTLETGRKVMLLAPMVRGAKGAHAEVFEKILKAGLVRARVDGELFDAADPPKLAKTKPHSIEVVVDRIIIKAGLEDRVDESVGLALKLGEGACLVSAQSETGWDDHLYSSRLVCPQCGESFAEIEPRTFSFNSPYGACPDCSGLGLRPSSTEESATPCGTCAGTRMLPFSRHVRVAGITLPELSRMTIPEAISTVSRWLGELRTTGEQQATAFLVVKRLVGEITRRLEYLQRVGVEYLSLDRRGETLSGGETQRVRLARCLGTGLRGVCYVLDEPTVGLHPRDTGRLLKSLTDLRDQGATVVVVEHDLEVIRQSDYVLDLGPGAGTLGGELIGAGTPHELMDIPDSITGACLREATLENQPQSMTQQSTNTEPLLVLTGARQHNLRDVDITIPRQALTCVTGVSGSGKSSLIIDCLVPQVRQSLGLITAVPEACGLLKLDTGCERLVVVDQSPLGKSGRSNPATYSGIWDEIRKLLARTKEAKIRGYSAQRFSLLQASGRCSACHGHGTRWMTTGPGAEVVWECPVCQGRRFNPATLAVKYRGHSAADLMALTFTQAAELFQPFAQLHRMVLTFVELGLGHLSLGQPATQLSGGEAQRIKLATELGREQSQPTLFVLDEPTTGLHARDVRLLVQLLRGLVEKGHSVVVIEHNLTLIRAADWIIDLGPEGGSAGGLIVASGSPQQFLKPTTPGYTARALQGRDL